MLTICLIEAITCVIILRLSHVRTSHQSASRLVLVTNHLEASMNLIFSLLLQLLLVLDDVVHLMTVSQDLVAESTIVGAIWGEVSWKMAWDCGIVKVGFLGRGD